jgi:hypothetical protein
VSDRLDDFRRQRALLREHLAWLDRQIAGLENSPASDPSSEPPAASFPGESGAAPPALNLQAADVDAEAILARYRQPAGAVQYEARRGCLLLFTVGLLLLAVGVAALYLFVKRARGH